jgi:hypothetical protein
MTHPLPSPQRRRSAALPCLLTLWAGCVDYGVSDDDDQVRDSLIIEERFTQYAAPMVDVLWVVDNTASMAREQAALADAFAGFVEALDEEQVAYQLGVVTTDVSGDQAGLLQGLPWIITPEHDDPVQAFSDAVQVGLDGAGPEAGLAAAWLALTEPMISEDNRGFLRRDSLLHVVVVSDSDDHSEAALEPWLGDGESAVDFFLAFLDERAQSSGVDPIFSAVAGELPNGCFGLAGRALPAAAYDSLVTATDGVFASICSGDMAPVLQGLGSASLVYEDSFVLQAEPLEGTIAVWIDDTRLNDGWAWFDEPSRVVFDTPPPPDAGIRVRYTAREDEA